MPASKASRPPNLVGYIPVFAFDSENHTIVTRVRSRETTVSARDFCVHALEQRYTAALWFQIVLSKASLRLLQLYGSKMEGPAYPA